METTVATLLLVSASVVLACVVVNYAINTALVTMNTDSLPEVDQLKEYISQYQNETDAIIRGLDSQPSPTPTPIP